MWPLDLSVGAAVPAYLRLTSPLATQDRRPGSGHLGSVSGGRGWPVAAQYKWWLDNGPISTGCLGRHLRHNPAQKRTHQDASRAAPTRQGHPQLRRRQTQTSSADDGSPRLPPSRHPPSLPAGLQYHRAAQRARCARRRNWRAARQ